MNTNTNLSDISNQRLSQCDSRLVQLVETVAQEIAVVVMVGYRDQTDQDAAYNSGHSKEKWPNSKHNQQPSLAVDIAPAPYDPNNTARLTYFAGYVMGVASKLGIPVRWGGDFAQCWDPTKNTFHDLFHFELMLDK